MGQDDEALAAELERVSRRLAAVFRERVATLAEQVDPARRGAWAATAAHLHGEGGWQGPLLAQAWLESGSVTALEPDEYPRLAALGLALAGASRDRSLFAAFPAGVASWAPGARARLFDVLEATAQNAPREAHALAGALPAALAPLPGDVRAALLEVLAALGPGVASRLITVVPVVGALVGAVPGARRLEALALVRDVAVRAPLAGLAALRSLPRAYEAAPPAAVRRWFATGLGIAEESPRAGEAYFALESRTGLRMLAAGSTAAVLEESAGVWRKLVQMLSGEPVRVAGVEATSLCLPLGTGPTDGEVRLPERIDLLPTLEENARLYRLLAAQAAGRRLHGTYAVPGLLERLRDPAAPELLEDCFCLADGVRVWWRLGAAYAGLAADARWAGTRLLARFARAVAPGPGMVLDALVATVLAGEAPVARPAWVPAAAVRAVLHLTAPLADPAATAEDAFGVAHALVLALAAGERPRTRREAEAQQLAAEDLGWLDPTSYGDERVPGDADAPFVRSADQPEAPGDEMRLELRGAADDPTLEGRPLSLEELRRLLAMGADVSQAFGDGADGPGLPITDLLGKIPPEELEALRKLVEAAEDDRRRARRGVTAETPDGPAFLYDEWDETIADYRSRWCRLHEVDIGGDSGEFFGRALAENARLIPEVRRQFQRLRPETYRPVRGLEDGEDFDLNAVIDARAERLAGRAPSTKLYRSRVREERDVATLFLLDMSASTDEPLDKDAGGRRIIDVAKDALVVMTEALDELGDAYAIYGFSGQGRANVEFYPVKGFNQPLGPGVKARIGAIEPRRSTRMGTAVRHALTKMAAIGARSKHILLVSDGFPQDLDYGDDRRSHAYGIRDTAVALREAEAAGVVPFCITVDRAGHDYLREMCDEARYMVIDDVAALPRELPKIYQRVVRA